MLTLGGGKEVASLSFLGLFLLLQEEGGEEEEAQEGEADDLLPASKGQQARGQMRPGGWPLGESPSWSSRLS